MHDDVSFWQSNLESFGSDPEFEENRQVVQEDLNAAIEDRDNGNLRYWTVEEFQTSIRPTRVYINVYTQRFRIMSIEIIFTESRPNPEIGLDQVPIDNYEWIIETVRAMLLEKYDASQIVRDDFKALEGEVIDKVLEITDSDGNTIWFGHPLNDLLEFRILKLIYRYRGFSDIQNELEDQKERL